MFTYFFFVSIPLTNENRQEFVSLFVEYHLNRCVAKQFDAFKRGFDLVVNGPAFAIFTPEELELLVCGEPTLDFEELVCQKNRVGKQAGTDAFFFFFFAGKSCSV